MQAALGKTSDHSLDFSDGELQQGDCFLLCSDGVWGALEHARLQAALLAHPDARQAAGVTLYHLLTRKYPYGEVEPFQRPKFGDPLPPTRYRPDIPGWLENVLLKAVARDPARRFETAEEFLLALERGANRPLNRPLATPLAMRNPLLTWRIIAATSLVLNLLLLMLLTR